MTKWSVLDHLSLAHLRLCKNRGTLQRALDLAKRQSPHPILLEAIHDTLIQTDSLANALDPIIDTLSGAPAPTPQPQKGTLP